MRGAASRRLMVASCCTGLLLACGSSGSGDTGRNLPSTSPSTGGGGSASQLGSGVSGSAGTFGNAMNPPAAPATHPVTSGISDAGLRMGECASALVNVSKNMPTIVFVVDGSASMCADLGGATRWQALRTALLDPTNGLVYRLQDSVSFGATIYDGTIDPTAFFAGGMPPAMPGTPENPECAAGATVPDNVTDCPHLVEVPPALNNAAALDSMFPMMEIGGSTPTDKALSHVMDMLIAMRQNQAPDQKAQSPTYVILATDGTPNDICTGGMNTDVRPLVLAAADRGAAAGITTWVISLADDATLQMHLDEVAKHGDPGNPMAHTFTPSNPDELVKTLAGLLGGAVGCNVSLNGQVKVGLECMGKVELNGNPLPCCVPDPTGNGNWTCDGAPASMPNGWHLVDPGTIELVGDVCAEFLSAPSEQLKASFPCEVFMPK